MYTYIQKQTYVRLRREKIFCILVEGETILERFYCGNGDNNDSVHIVCRCKKCGQKMLECDYTSGDFTIETKCVRCTRVLVAKGMTFNRLKAYAEHGEALLKI